MQSKHPVPIYLCIVFCQTTAQRMYGKSIYRTFHTLEPHNNTAVACTPNQYMICYGFWPDRDQLELSLIMIWPDQRAQCRPTDLISRVVLCFQYLQAQQIHCCKSGQQISNKSIVIGAVNWTWRRKWNPPPLKSKKPQSTTNIQQIFNKYSTNI